MARPLRLQLSGVFYHILARGNARQDIYLDDYDRHRFLSTLGESAQRHGFLVHAYCMMRNHYHLIIETLRAELSAGIRRINGLYSQYFNKRHERVGHLFQGRFKSILLDSNSYFLSAHRYIHRNPVRKGLVKAAFDYEWSSCREFVGLRTPPAWLRTDTSLAYFSGSPMERHSRYAEFVAIPADENPFRDAYAQSFLGSPGFVEAMRREAQTFAEPEHTGHRQFEERLAPEIIDSLIIEEFGGLSAGMNGWRQSEKALRIYFLREHSRLSLKELAELFHITISAVSHQVGKVHSRLLADIEFSHLMATLEMRLRSLIQVSRPDPDGQAGILISAS